MHTAAALNVSGNAMSNEPRTCKCGASLDGRHIRAQFCWQCVRERESRPLMVKAHRAVQTAVARGQLPNLQHVEIDCVDCGEYRANCFDHRDYRYPLLVAPVCGGCNKRRGPGHPYNT